jgi:hypothetical protein
MLDTSHQFAPEEAVASADHLIELLLHFVFILLHRYKKRFFL